MVTTFLVGNGLGMDYKSEIFSLASAMSYAWDLIEDSDDIMLLQNILTLGTAPETEGQLRNLQRLYWHLEGSKLNDENHILTLIDDFFVNIVKQFFSVNSNVIKDCDLINSLVKYIACAGDDKPCHVATLNYDKLLYGSFTNVPAENGNTVFGSYKLIDGFFPDDNRLIYNTKQCQKRNPSAGWYLQLHGSPLFSANTNHNDIEPVSQTIVKENIADKEEQFLVERKIRNAMRDQIILTDPTFKTAMIEKNKLLSDYWCKFKTILSKTDKLCVIGYGGNDPHVNELVRNQCRSGNKTMRVYIVEWDHKDGSTNNNWFNKEKRKLFWKAKFGTCLLKLDVYPHILDVKVDKILG